MIFTWLLLAALLAGPDDPFPHIKLGRTGHLELNAQEHRFSWHLTGQERKANLTVRVVFVEPGTMKFLELSRSAEAKGTVTLEPFQRGPGLYALLVYDGQTPIKGMRLSWLELRPNCPEKEAWWP
ncbi:MAG TPA: hypothetical protein VNA04_02430 [Thermoanaerobaculia bacterium]|nr:hypothetical protein [Thermoanaerobaculia bacterium]